MSSSKRKSERLGMPHGTAGNRLRKLILFDLLQQFNLDQCFRCGQKIDSIDDLSIEHKKSWELAEDPKAAFFDLENIAFSHLRCNIGAPRSPRTHCPQGHAYTPENTKIRGGQRYCHKCVLKQNREYMRRSRSGNRSGL